MTLQDPAPKVLLIDDDQQIHDLVRFHLEDRVGSLIVASDACSGRVLAAQENVIQRSYTSNPMHPVAVAIRVTWRCS